MVLLTSPCHGLAWCVQGNDYEQSKEEDRPGLREGKRPPRSSKSSRKASAPRATPSAAATAVGHDTPRGSSEAGQASAPAAERAPQRTDYALARPRRQLGRQRLALAATTESSLLVQPLEFIGQPGSGAPLAQPFQLTIQAQVRRGTASCVQGAQSRLQQWRQGLIGGVVACT